MLVPVKTPPFLQHLIPGLHFRIRGVEKCVYLTFDDGPVPGLCDFILDELRIHQAKATFFLVGENVVRQPDLVKRMRQDGHRIGNHTHNHLNGFKTSGRAYRQNIEMAEKVLKPFLSEEQVPLFRPPYGKIGPVQARELQKMGYAVVMWDVLTKDYDTFREPEEIVRNTLDHVEDGSIVVLHDNLKADRNIREGLPAILSGLREMGFRLEALPDRL